MKKTIINICLIIMSIIIYYLQANFFSWFNIAGIKPNIFIILVMFIGLFANQSMGTIYGMIIGIFLDFVIGSKVGITAISMGIIGFLAGIIDKNFSKDTRMTMIFIVLSSTIIFESIECIMKYILCGNIYNIISFLKVLSIETLYNIIITIILYPLIQKVGYYIENEFKGNKILTRYF